MNRGCPCPSDGFFNDLGDAPPAYLDDVPYSPRRHAQPTTASFAEVRIIRSFDEWKEVHLEAARLGFIGSFSRLCRLLFSPWPLADWDPGLLRAKFTQFWKEAMM